MNEGAAEARSRALVVVRDRPEAEALLAVGPIPPRAEVVAGTGAAHTTLTARGVDCCPPGAAALGPCVETQAREQIRRLAQRLRQVKALTTDGLPLGALLWGPLFRALTPLVTSLRAADVILARERPTELLVPIASSRAAVVASLDHFEGLAVSAEAHGVPCRALGPPAGASAASLLRLWRVWRTWHGLRLLLRAFAWPRVLRGPRPEPADIVLSPWSAAELAALRPVAAALVEAASTVAAVESPAYYAAQPAVGRPDTGVPLHLLGQFSATGDWLAARRAGAAAARVVAGLIADGTIPELLDSERSQLLPRMGALRRLPVVLGWEAAYAALTHAASERCLRSLGARAVVVSKCRGVEMAAFLAAAAGLGLPSAFLPHGLYRKDPIWRDVQATVVLADGPHLATLLTSRGHPAETVAVVGPPKYDAALRRLRTGRDSICRELGLDPAHRFVCVAATGEPTFASAACAALAPEAAARDWRILVKLHPRFSGPQDRRDVHRAAGARARLFTHVDPLLVYAVSEALVTGVSTSAFEAMIVGTPVVYMGSLEQDRVHGYAAAGAAAHAPTSHALAEVVAEVVESPQRRAELIARGREFAARHFAGLDGRAAERCARAVRALAGGATAAEVIADLASAAQGPP
ncbi:MAG: CDP-glycerol glycerophosphotransferase family protein [Armatimonadota bacterium]